MKLSSVYFDAVYKLPEDLRMRRPLEESVIRSVGEGRNVCIRGFWRIGKTELMKAALDGLASRNKACGMHFDLRSETQGDGVPKTGEEVLAKMAGRVGHLFKALGADVRVDPDDPLRALGMIDSPVYVGIDELIAIDALPRVEARGILRLIKGAPQNVRLLLVAHRHQGMDGVFGEELCSDPGFETIFIPPLSDSEMERIIREPAVPYGFGYTDDAVEKLARISGNKPWETLSFCYMIADFLEESGHMRPGVAVGGDFVEQLVAFPNIIQDQLGMWTIDNYLRIFLKAMHPLESKVIEMIACGDQVDRQKHGEALGRLHESGWVRGVERLEVNSSLFEYVIRQLECGNIRVEADGRVVW
jgi:hypothetical protein